jgi:Transposase zinc-binding domain
VFVASRAKANTCWRSHAAQRNFCSSCQAKRAVLFAEKLASEILPPVSCRHWTFTVPKAIRGLFERERRLLGLLSRAAYL